MEKELCSLTLFETKHLLESGEISSVDLVESYLARINALDSAIHAYITVVAKQALLQAKECDRLRKAGDRRTLLGIPVAVKDSFQTFGVKTTVASKMLADYVGQYDATVVSKLKSAGAVLLGKTNLDEFCMGFTSETSAFQTTSNPWNIKHVPGGSSGGSAAATAADLCVFAIGSEHYDSIRQPAAWCGVVGVKPSYGLLSRYGVIAMASSLECPGPICKSVQDAATVLTVLSGYDPRDAQSLYLDYNPISQNLNKSSVSLRLGIPENLLDETVDVDVKKAFFASVQLLESLGHTIKRFTLPDSVLHGGIFELLYRTEVASNLARYDNLRYGNRVRGQVSNIVDHYWDSRSDFGSLIKKLIVTDLSNLSSYDTNQIYQKALLIRSLMVSEFDKLFEEVDVILTPSSPCVAFEKGFYQDGRYVGTAETDKYRTIVDLIAQMPALCGFPALSIPNGMTKGLPIGLHMFGPFLSDMRLLQLAYCFEQQSDWHTMKPLVNNTIL